MQRRPPPQGLRLGFPATYNAPWAETVVPHWLLRRWKLQVSFEFHRLLAALLQHKVRTEETPDGHLLHDRQQAANAGTHRSAFTPFGGPPIRAPSPMLEAAIPTRPAFVGPGGMP